jgi:hypothetical protein
MNRLALLPILPLCALWSCVRDEVETPADSDAGADAAALPADASPDGYVEPADALPPVPRVPEKHRPAAEMCDDLRTPGSAMPGIEGASCGADADCTDGDNGRCVDFRGDQQCNYDECFADADCPGMGVCACGGGFWSDNNVCLNDGNCRTDADCGEGGACSPTLGDCGDYAGVVAYYCHTPTDECVDDADCTGTAGRGYCAYNPAAGHWMCSDAQCVG